MPSPKNLTLTQKAARRDTARRKLYEKRRTKLINFLSRPDSEFLTRRAQREYLGMRERAFYQMFTREDLLQIEREALQLRRDRYAPDLAAVDRGLLDRAASGDPAAAKLVYQKFEGWSEKASMDITGTFSLSQLAEALSEEESSSDD